MLHWIIDRCAGQGKATETPIGWVPPVDAIDSSGLNISPAVMQDLLKVDAPAWKQELQDVADFLQRFGDRLPAKLSEQQRRIAQRLN